MLTLSDGHDQDQLQPWLAYDPARNRSGDMKKARHHERGTELDAKSAP
jgi:hypothetical protein